VGLPTATLTFIYHFSITLAILLFNLYNEHMENNLVICQSGGLDSLIMYHYAVASKSFEEITCVHVRFGQAYSTKEYDAITRVGPWFPKVEIIDIEGLMPLIERRLSNQIIPSRNVMLSVIGSMIADTVWLGVLDGEQLGKEHDKSDRFFQDTQSLLSFTNEFFQPTTTIETPFRHLSKGETIQWALEHGIPKEILFETTSCYHPTRLKCGECLTCVKRAMAFLENGIIEPGYSQNPFDSDYFRELSVEIPKALANNDFSRFTEKRARQFVELTRKIKGK
jgi:7-cyano-7-deazaguanine synthase in queuosine biosynthesis